MTLDLLQVYSAALQEGYHHIRLVGEDSQVHQNTMGIKGIHYEGAFTHQKVGQSTKPFCPWCGKAGSNTGMMVNHLRVIHYRLVVICTHCHAHLASTTSSMQKHLLVCAHKPACPATRHVSAAQGLLNPLLSAVNDSHFKYFLLYTFFLWNIYSNAPVCSYWWQSDE